MFDMPLITEVRNKHVSFIEVTADKKSFEGGLRRFGKFKYIMHHTRTSQLSGGFSYRSKHFLFLK